MSVTCAPVEVLVTVPFPGPMVSTVSGRAVKVAVSEALWVSVRTQVAWAQLAPVQLENS